MHQNKWKVNVIRQNHAIWLNCFKYNKYNASGVIWSSDELDGDTSARCISTNIQHLIFDYVIDNS